ncbi:MAG: hypothetical protein AB1767_11540 [Bacillota bacterium]
MRKGCGRAAILLLTVFLLTCSWAVLAGAEEVVTESVFTLLEPHVATYNENIDSVPDAVKSMFDDERINFHIDLGDDTEEVIGVVTSKDACEVTEFVAGGLDDPTLRVYITMADIERHIADPQGDEILDTVLNLKLEGVGFLNQAKVFLFGVVQKIARWFT